MFDKQGMKKLKPIKFGGKTIQVYKDEAASEKLRGKLKQYMFKEPEINMEKMVRAQSKRTAVKKAKKHFKKSLKKANKRGRGFL